ncbi:hypothetical protein [Pseudomonas sp. SWRI81]|uniref:hypothetical protein n=1 Tax=Pseudomonas sp. SWRI81 TaxID=2745505 RepID=UPI001EE2F99D|nr:hypothetical protein [Pseudomonas sp. SWRI81]
MSGKSAARVTDPIALCLMRSTRKPADMKKLLAVLLIIFCASCAKDHSVPPANLNFLSVEKEGNSSLYAVYYGSDVDLLNLFNRGKRVGAASTMLECALGDDQDFSITNRLRYSAYGVIDEDASNKARGRFNYVTSAFLRQTPDNGSTQDNLSVPELNALLSQRKSVPCKVVVTAYGYKPYYSNTMNIPTADLLREINKPE